MTPKGACLYNRRKMSRCQCFSQKFCGETLPFMTEFRLGKMPQTCVRSEEFREKVRLLFATKVGVKVTLSFCQPVGTQQISWM